MYLGDFSEDQTVRFHWGSTAVAGESITRATNGTISVYKDGNTTQTTTGVTDTEDFDTLTGVHYCEIATTDAFYVAGADYTVILSGATIDGKAINTPLAHFSIENRGVSAAAVTDIQSGLATAAALDAVDNFVDTEVGAIKTVVDAIQAKTDNLPTDPADASVIAGRFDTLDTSVADLPTNAELATAFTEIKGATWSAVTDTLEAIRDRGDAAWITATGFSTHSAADVWAVATRILTAGTNIALAKGTGVTGFNDLSAAQVNAEVVDALNTDTYSEPAQGTPGATISLAAKINYLYKAWRNKTTQTSTTYSLFNDDAATVDHKATTSDDGTTFSKSEVTSGP